MTIRLCFRSGMSRGNDMQAAIAAKVPLGCVAGELRAMQCHFTLPNYLKQGGAIFVDSGAFSEFTTGDVPDFDKILDRYLDIADTADFQGASCEKFYVVAPDKVGDQTASLERLAQYRDQVRELIDLGCRVVVPIQRGAVDPNTMIAAVTEILGTDDFVAGIPSNEEAMSVAECATIKHHAFHILGRVQKNDEQIRRIAALQANQANADITADANWLRSRLDKICQATDALRIERMMTRERNQPLQPSPRTVAITELIRLDTAWAA